MRNTSARILYVFTLAIASVLLSSSFAIAQAAKDDTKMDMKHVKLTMADAKKIAMEKHPGKIKCAELENENGVVQYSFDIKTTEGLREVGINANTGEVVEDKLENAVDEAKEKATDAAEMAAKKAAKKKQ